MTISAHEHAKCRHWLLTCYWAVLTHFKVNDYLSCVLCFTKSAWGSQTLGYTDRAPMTFITRAREEHLWAHNSQPMGSMTTNPVKPWFALYEKFIFMANIRKHFNQFFILNSLFHKWTKYRAPITAVFVLRYNEYLHTVSRTVRYLPYSEFLLSTVATVLVVCHVCPISGSGESGDGSDLWI